MISTENEIKFFTQDEIETFIADAQREADAFIAWLRSPEGVAWLDEQAREARKIAEEFKRDIAAGVFDLTPAELEQLRMDGIFVSHRKKGGRVNDWP